MIDLHTHSIFSDGELIPSELVRRLESMGYSAVAITDHVDSSNLDFIVPRIMQVSEDLNVFQTVKVVPGVELTHVPPRQISSLVAKARDLGARLVLVHGETIVEPVARDTNLAAIEAGADVLAHPGMISEKEAKMAAERGVFLEISARKGHSFTNGHVARLAMEVGASLILNSDAHGPLDFMTRDFASRVAEGAGLPTGALKGLLDNSRHLLEGIGYTL